MIEFEPRAKGERRTTRSDTSLRAEPGAEWREESALLDELDDTVRAGVATIEARARTIAGFPRSTILPEPRPSGDTGGRAAYDKLAALAGAQGLDLSLHETLGEGGMGIVHLANQRSLGRDVAVKTLREDRRDQGSILELLREAWITGSLEHPNVLPVYDVRLDDDGIPLVVLKRIEGVDWADILHDEAAAGKRLGDGELLEHNLDILMQLCRVVAFAHSRGFIHRDLKPDNVRIGEFGEVYLLDWGIALALRDDGSGRFPLARDAEELAGTPSYMAPEMLGNRAAELSERTDVYLLGAILHEILAGKPPHQGPTVVSIVSSVLRSNPPLEGVPEELAAIVRRAMRPSPADRFESADALREELSRYLRQRGSRRLCDTAAARLDELQALVASPNGHEDRARAYNLLGECRFGFQHALEMWPDNDLARDGLGRVLVAMIEWELGRGDAEAAFALHRQLDDPHVELESRVRAALEEQRQRAEHIAALESLERDQDESVGARTRAFLAGVLCLYWTASPLAFQFVFTESYLALTVWGAVTVALAVGLGWWARDSLSKTQFNRRVTLSVTLILASPLLMLFGGWALGLPLPTVLVLMTFGWALCMANIAVIHPPTWPCAALMVVAFAVSALRPELRYYSLAVADFFCGLYLVKLWRPDAWFPGRA